MVLRMLTPGAISDTVFLQEGKASMVHMFEIRNCGSACCAQPEATGSTMALAQAVMQATRRSTIWYGAQL